MNPATSTGTITFKIEISDSNPFLRFFRRVYTGWANYLGGMPRRNRIIVPGLPHHITQRGNGQKQIFDSDGDRHLFLDLLARYAAEYELAIWGYCLMSNHFHLIAVPRREDATAKALGRLLADYARYLNLRRGSSGHLWQARYYSVPMDPPHCWKALAYVERNPVRAEMVERAGQYPWSSAQARLGMRAAPAWLDMQEWRGQWSPEQWQRLLEDRASEAATGAALHEVMLSGYPLGQELAERLERELGIRLRRGKAGRPPKVRTAAGAMQ